MGRPRARQALAGAAGSAEPRVADCAASGQRPGRARRIMSSPGKDGPVRGAGGGGRSSPCVVLPSPCHVPPLPQEPTAAIWQACGGSQAPLTEPQSGSVSSDPEGAPVPTATVMGPVTAPLEPE